MKNYSTTAVFILFSACFQGGLRGDDPEITLTAFVLIALAEAKQAGIRCASEVENVQVIFTKEQKNELIMKGSVVY